MEQIDTAKNKKSADDKAYKKARKIKDNNLNRATVKEHCIENPA
jgi:hypothetical protein